MGMGSLVICSFLSAGQMLYLFYSIDKHYLKVALGYKWVVDLIFTGGIMLTCLTSGTISGVILSIISGLSITLALMLARKAYGYRKLETVAGKKVWVEYPPTINKKSLYSLKDSVQLKISKITNEVTGKMA